MILGFVLEKFIGLYNYSIEPLIKPLDYIVMTIGIIWFIAIEIEKICNDLKNAVFLGDKSKMITEALSDYCKKKSNR